MCAIDKLILAYIEIVYIYVWLMAVKHKDNVCFFYQFSHDFPITGMFTKKNNSKQIHSILQTDCPVQTRTINGNKIEISFFYLRSFVDMITSYVIK